MVTRGANMPLVSIIIANHNYGRFLEEAILSVVAQNMGDKVELIICDAASTDNSVEIIKKYANGLPPNTLRSEWVDSNSLLSTPNSQIISWWCSEKDGGQSAAFNKGFSHARGRFLTWLNADDVMLPGVIEKLKIAVDKYPQREWFVGGVLWLDPEMRIVNCGRGRKFSEVNYRRGRVNAWGPSSFFTKSLLDSVGGVDERFHYMMDTDLWQRFAFIANARYVPFADYAWGLRMHPEAKMSGHNFKADGKLDTKSSDAEKLKASKHHEQIEKEANIIAEYFDIKQPTKFRRLLDIAWIKVLAARIDRWRYHGVHYLSMFK